MIGIFADTNKIKKATVEEEKAVSGQNQKSTESSEPKDKQQKLNQGGSTNPSSSAPQLTHEALLASLASNPNLLSLLTNPQIQSMLAKK